MKINEETEIYRIVYELPNGNTCYSDPIVNEGWDFSPRLIDFLLKEVPRSAVRKWVELATVTWDEIEWA